MCAFSFSATGCGADKDGSGGSDTSSSVGGGESFAGTYISEEEASIGLEYTLRDDGAQYTVTRGTCSDSDVVIPSTHNGLPVTHIGYQAFYQHYDLKSIKIPDSVTSIGGWAFYGCRGLTSVTIPDNVTSIAYSAFCKCSSLTSVTIGNGLTSIGPYVFYECSSLASVYYNGTKEQWNAIEKGHLWRGGVPTLNVVYSDK